MLNSARGESGEQTLLPFKNAPFPLNDQQASTFFNVHEEGRRGRDSPRAGLLWEDTSYSDNRVLMARPPHFDGSRHPALIVYLHGNQAILERDVLERQQVPAQIAAAQFNALLLAPQFASDALDSSPGNFAQSGHFAAFIREAVTRASQWQNNSHLNYQLRAAPIILVAYSGGYLPAAHILEVGGVGDRVKGVILLDALYGSEEVFANWLRRRHHSVFFLSVYTEPARASNERLQSLLRQQRIAFKTRMPQTLGKNSITFVQLDPETVHQDLLTQAWTQNPLTQLLQKIKIK